MTNWCNRVIRWSFYLLFILVPLILTPWNFELFEYNKMMLTYALTTIILAAWLVKMIETKEFRVAKTPLDIPLWIFVASQLVSSLFSMDPHVSWFGYYSRFNGGMFSVFTYTALYYAFVTNFTEIIPLKKKTDLTGPAIFRLTRLVKVMLTTAAVVSIYGALEHFGIDKNLWVQDVQSRVFSTLGQPNWLAAYIVALIPAGMALYLSEKKQLSSWFYAGISVLFFIVLLWTRSRSGYASLAVADVIFWGLLYLKNKKNQSEVKRLALPFLILHAAFIVIVFFNGTYVDQIDRWFTFQGWRDRITHHVTPAPKPEMTPAGTALETGGTDSGIIRKYVWEAAIYAWKANTKQMLIGTGTETFAFAFYQYRPTGHNMTSEWDFLYNKAHNEYLNYLATTGAFGLLSYLALLVTFIWWFIMQEKKPLESALFAGWLSILVTNFFGFSVVVMQLFLFLFPAIVIALSHPEMKYTGKPLRLPLWTAWIPPLLCAALIFGIYRYWKADTYYAAANRLEQQGVTAQSLTLDQQAIALNPGEPVYHDDISSVLAALSLAAAQNNNSTEAATLAKQSLAQDDSALTTSPQNVNFWKTRTKLYYTFSAFDPSLNAAAIQALEKAASLSPNDPKIYYNLAILYGRAGENDQALTLLNKAKMLKPDYRDAYFGLYVFYTQMKDTANAKTVLQTYLNTVNPNDKDFQDRLKALQ